LLSVPTAAAVVGAELLAQISYDSRQETMRLRKSQTTSNSCVLIASLESSSFEMELSLKWRKRLAQWLQRT